MNDLFTNSGISEDFTINFVSPNRVRTDGHGEGVRQDLGGEHTEKHPVYQHIEPTEDHSHSDLVQLSFA